ncbi:MAG: SGNH/GDSL hydrolase family protein [Sideroxyarcus sp.]|nr:SGNH/GDSL hydrolase family protein [Sideroxyarcus sp.]
MRYIGIAALMLSVAIVSGCGGGGGGSQAPRVGFTSQVSFGDSLSDVGSYKVGGVAAVGGGQFTINGAGKNWVELMAAQMGLAAPCAAQTGSDDGTGVPSATNVTPVNHANCYAYAQGGARVTDAIGIGNKNNPSHPSNALTVPVATQVANHLAAVGGSFSGSEVVYVLAGANDVLTQAGTYPVLVGAPNNLPPAQAMAMVTAAVTTAANELAALVAEPTTGMIAKGAKYVVVVNVPDVASTPYAAGAEVASPGSKALIDGLVMTFNAQLRTQLANNANVLLVDAYTINRDQVLNPAPYGLTDVQHMACDVAGTFLATNFGGSSLGCSAANPASMTAGVSGDTHYLFADGVHPTPYGYWLLARLVSKEMLVKGWL